MLVSPPSKISAIEIAACEPLAGRLPTQAKTRVRAGGRPAAMPAGDDFNRRISSIVAGGYAHEQLLRISMKITNF